MGISCCVREGARRAIREGEGGATRVAAGHSRSRLMSHRLSGASGIVLPLKSGSALLLERLNGRSLQIDPAPLLIGDVGVVRSALKVLPVILFYIVLCDLGP